MRVVTLVGVLLLAAGFWVIVHGLSYPRQTSVLKVGEFEATYEEQRTIPGWVGGCTIAVGAVCVYAGLRRRRDVP